MCVCISLMLYSLNMVDQLRPCIQSCPNAVNYVLPCKCNNVFYFLLENWRCTQAHSDVLLLHTIVQLLTKPICEPLFSFHSCLKQNLYFMQNERTQRGGMEVERMKEWRWRGWRNYYGISAWDSLLSLTVRLCSLITPQLMCKQNPGSVNFPREKCSKGERVLLYLSSYVLMSHAQIQWNAFLASS